MILLASALMDQRVLFDGLVNYLYLVILITFHEFGHAWMADRLKDSTPRDQGRVTLNPAAHIDPIGTVLLPLLVVVFNALGHYSLSRFIIGWGRPVMVNPSSFRNRRTDMVLVALAGPAMNILLAAAAVGLTWVARWTGSSMMHEFCGDFAVLNLYLAFFNLLPVPPLDGSQILRGLIGFSEELYLQMCQFGLLMVMVVVQIPLVRVVLSNLTLFSYRQLRAIFGLT
jgi:Zn-dependent protease